MSDAPAPGGLVARLLDRADGRVTALRPSVRPTFAAEQTRDEPFLETTEETPAAPPAASPVVTASPAERHEAAAPLPPAPASRLMPVAAAAEAPQAAPVSAAAVAAPGEASAAPPRVEPSAPAADAPSDERPRAAEPRLVPVRSDPAGTHRSDNLTAAVMRLLDPSAAGADEPGPPRLAPQAERPARLEARESVGAGRPADPTPSDASPAGVTIHIGEIVIAPEPRAASDTGPRPAWQPPLSLSDYRASRARERR